MSILTSENNPAPDVDQSNNPPVTPGTSTPEVTGSLLNPETLVVSSEVAELLTKYPELKDNATLTKYTTVKDLLEGHANLSSKIGSMISLPKENATEEERLATLDKIYKKLGKPETPEDYKLEISLPEGQNIDDTLLSDFKKTAHALNLTNEQTDKVVKFYNETIQKAVEQNNLQSSLKDTQYVEEQIAELKTTWGAKYKDNTQIAVNAAKKLLSPETLGYLDKTGLGNNAKFIQDIYKLSQQFTPDSTPITGGSTGMTPEQRDAKLIELTRKCNDRKTRTPALEAERRELLRLSVQ